MKNVLLLTLGLSFFVLSCKKKDVQTENYTSDSATITDTTPDTIQTAPVNPSDTITATRDSIATKNRTNQNQKVDSLNR